MIRDIIKIDEDLCNGCGLCIPNCHEGALQIIDGKARLVSELMCDGLGACIGYCPEGAISIEKRKAEAYDEKRVIENHQRQSPSPEPVPGGCPGFREEIPEAPAAAVLTRESSQSELRHWPVQMHLINPHASYFHRADLLIAADCVAYSVAGFHGRFLRGKSLVIACPKLDRNTEIYVEKLKILIDKARINTITVMMMEVPCCGGLLHMIRAALEGASEKIPVKQIIVSIRGEVLKETWL
jgi:NAD-dependent dihydropyrimidine dehydrogenase PreA subunit